MRLAGMKIILGEGGQFPVEVERLGKLLWGEYLFQKIRWVGKNFDLSCHHSRQRGVGWGGANAIMYKTTRGSVNFKHGSSFAQIIFYKSS